MLAFAYTTTATWTGCVCSAEGAGIPLALDDDRAADALDYLGPGGQGE
jgi:hypothetical protein